MNRPEKLMRFKRTNHKLGVFLVGLTFLAACQDKEIPAPNQQTGKQCVEIEPGTLAVGESVDFSMEQYEKTGDSIDIYTFNNNEDVVHARHSVTNTPGSSSIGSTPESQSHSKLKQQTIEFTETDGSQTGFIITPRPDGAVDIGGVTCRTP